MSVRVGAFELRKTGASRYDWRDPYHIAVSLSWPGFLLLFVVLELALNLTFASLSLVQIVTRQTWTSSTPEPMNRGRNGRHPTPNFHSHRDVVEAECRCAYIPEMEDLR